MGVINIATELIKEEKGLRSFSDGESYLHKF